MLFEIVIILKIFKRETCCRAQLRSLTSVYCCIYCLLYDISVIYCIYISCVLYIEHLDVFVIYFFLCFVAVYLD